MIITINYREGDIVLVNLNNSIGHQQKGIRPAIIISNDVGNTHSPTVKIVPATSKRNGRNIPTHAFFKAEEMDGITMDSVFEAESECSINKFQIIEKLGEATEEQMSRIALALAYASPIIYKAFIEHQVHNTELFKRLMHNYT